MSQTPVPPRDYCNRAIRTKHALQGFANTKPKVRAIESDIANGPRSRAKPIQRTPINKTIGPERLPRRLDAKIANRQQAFQLVASLGEGLCATFHAVDDGYDFPHAQAEFGHAGDGLQR